MIVTEFRVSTFHIGRGAEKPSEMAARLGTVQTNLSRLLQQLLEASVLTQELRVIGKVIWNLILFALIDTSKGAKLLWFRK